MCDYPNSECYCHIEVGKITQLTEQTNETKENNMRETTDEINREINVQNKDDVKSSELSELLGWLTKIQKEYDCTINLELYNDGSGNVIHHMHDEPEIIKSWENLKKLLELIKTP